MTVELGSLRNRWSEELFSQVLPFWLNNSIDNAFGGYFTCLDESGIVFDKTKYHWLQGRQVWMLSKVYNSLNHNQNEDMTFFNAAMVGVKFMKTAKDDSTGHLYFSTTEDGEKLHFQRKPYAAVFYSLGLLEMHKAIQNFNSKQNSGRKFTENNYFEEAQQSFDLLLRWIDDPALIGRPHPPASSQVTKKTLLADIMCVCSLALEFYEYFETEHPPGCHNEQSKYKDIMIDACNRVTKHLHNELNVFLENAGCDGVDLSTPAGRLFNPGHSIECSWFLLHVVEKIPNNKVKDLALKTLKGALEIGWDKEHGGITYIIDICGKPLLDATLTSDGKLWWPLCEALYATIKAFAVTGDNYYFEWTKSVWEYIDSHLIDKRNGGEWWGYLQKDGSLFNSCKGGAYKGCFHVPRALLFSIKVADQILQIETEK